MGVHWRENGWHLPWHCQAPPLATSLSLPGIARMATSMSCFSGRRCPGTTPLFRSLDICIHKVTRESICFGILWSVSNQQVDDTFRRSWERSVNQLNEIFALLYCKHSLSPTTASFFKFSTKFWTLRFLVLISIGKLVRTKSDEFLQLMQGGCRGGGQGSFGKMQNFWRDFFVSPSQRG